MTVNEDFIKRPDVLTVGQLSRATGIKPGTISTAKKSRNGNPPKLKSVKFGKKEYIDCDDRQNRIWINEICEKNGFEFSLVRAYDSTAVAGGKREPSPEKKAPKKNETVYKTVLEKVADGEIEGDAEAEEFVDWGTKKKQLECEKLEKDNRKKDIEIARISGKLIPTEEVKVVQNYAFSSFTASVNSAVLNELGIIVTELGGDNADFKRYADRMRNRMVDFVADGKKSIKQGLQGVVDDYMEKNKA